MDRVTPLRRIIRSSPERIFRLPSSGRLLICTDLHGNLRDFERIRVLFEELVKNKECPFLLFTGDLIHGPNCEPDEWPTYLGAFFIDQSKELVLEYIKLKEKYPSQVACLLGNHEHSHVGGPHTPKFWPDETLHFEQMVGPRLTRRFKKLFQSLPTVAIANCGIAVTHAAPNAVINGPEDIERICYRGMESLPITTVEQLPLLGRLLWSRSCPESTAREFLVALSKGGPTLGVVIYGHEIIASGYKKVGDEQLLLSTSFGVRDSCKYYLSLDLSKIYHSTRSIREEIELLRLYPME